MFYRQTRREFEKFKGAANRRKMKRLIDSGRVPGLLAYVGDQPVGWCSVAPREEFGSLARSRILKPVDDQPVWSVVCFFVAKEYRRHKITVRLLKAACTYARHQGARIIEGYAVEPKIGEMPDVFAFHGLAAAFRAAGFAEVARRSPTRPIMRRTLR
jgi:GNAT superfamily N-acetyltransferase